MSEKHKKGDRQAITAKFVSAAKELLEADGVSSLSVRKISSRAGYHNSTIYAYFPDEDLLISLACVRFFADYTKALSALSREHVSPYQEFFCVWKIFCDAAFRQPDAFRHFFFGRHSGDLLVILNQYYELFPEEREQYSPVIEEMYYGSSFSERCLRILKPLAGTSGVRVDDGNLTLVNDLITAVFRDSLCRKCNDRELDRDTLTEQFLSALHYLIDL